MVMDITAFLNRKTQVHPTFKTEPITVIVSSYGDNLKSLIQNILFRLEPTGLDNKLIFYTDNSNNDSVTEFIQEFVGFFSTNMLTTSLRLPIDQLTNNCIVIHDTDNFSRMFSKKQEMFLGESLRDLSQKETLFLSLSYSGNLGRIALSNIEYNPIFGDVGLDNHGLSGSLDNQNFVSSYFPLMESKVFNVFNQIITEGLDVEQTIELLDLENISSTNAFKFDKMSLATKYFNNTIADLNLESVVDNPLNPIVLTENNYRQAYELTQKLLKRELSILQANLTQINSDIDVARYIVSGENTPFDSETLEQNKATNTYKHRVLQQLETIFTKVQRNEYEFSAEELVEIANITHTIMIQE